MQKQFPKAWNYLTSFEKELRSREKKKFDGDAWYQFGRHQNIDKQEVPKLLVPRLVARLQCFADESGRYYCDNVDVGGVVSARVENIWWLLGILNAPVTDTIFSWLSKPFRGEYKSANKQFIAPLPIPKTDRAGRAALSALAKQMQERATRRVDLKHRLEERLAATSRAPLPLSVSSPDCGPFPRSRRRCRAPFHSPSARSGWTSIAKPTRRRRSRSIDGIVHPASEADVTVAEGKLSFLIDEQEVARLFVSREEEQLAEAQWRAVAVDFDATGKNIAKRLVEQLRRTALTADRATAEQIIAIGAELARVSDVLRDDEAQLHEMTCYLFKLTDEERRLVQGARS